MSHPNADIKIATFKRRLRDLGFARVGVSGNYADLRHRGGPLITPAVFGQRPKRRDVLEALLTARAAYEAEQSRAAARRAEQADLAAALAPVSLPPARAALDGAAAIHQLADDFIVMSTRHDGVEAKGLIRLGWTREQLTDYADDARALAHVRQNGAFA